MAGLRTLVKDGFQRGGHDKDFKPAKIVEEKLYKQKYEYIPQGVPKKPSMKNEDNEVITGPRNFYTNPMKLGKVGKNTSFSGPIPYIEDDFDAKKKIAAKEREYHLSKLQDKPFSQKAKHTEMFNSYKQVYMEDPPIPARKPVVKEEGEPLHDKAFKPANPAKKGNHSTLEKFPVHMPDPPKEKKRIKYEDGQEPESPPGFKCTYKGLTRPSPSVATNFRNLKASYPSAFRK